MARRLFTALSALSLLLCVATLALWVRSYESLHDWQWSSAEGYWSVTVSRGVWRLHGAEVIGPGWTTTSRGLQHYRAPGAPDLTADPLYPRPGVGPWGGCGWAAHRDHNSAVWYVYSPGWLAPLAASALPLRWWVLYRGRWRRERRRGRGHCPACGYDLRATPGRCPECGEFPTG
jgi:hypothetical protein